MDGRMAAAEKPKRGHPLGLDAGRCRGPTKERPTDENAVPVQAERAGGVAARANALCGDGLTRPKTQGPVYLGKGVH